MNGGSVAQELVVKKESPSLKTSGGKTLTALFGEVLSMAMLDPYAADWAGCRDVEWPRDSRGELQKSRPEKGKSSIRSSLYK